MNYYQHNTGDFGGPSKVSRLPMVYVLTTRQFEYIKIGKTTSPKQRFINIQSGCPYYLSLWLVIRTPIAEKVEIALHQKMQHCRTRGEWFAPGDTDLDAIIEFFGMTNASVRGVSSALL